MKNTRFLFYNLLRDIPENCVKGKEIARHRKVREQKYVTINELFFQICLCHYLLKAEHFVRTFIAVAIKSAKIKYLSPEVGRRNARGS